MAGSTSRRRFSSGSVLNGTKPEAANTGMAMANTSTSTMPSQKAGIDMPSRAMPLASHSSGLPRRTAAMTPAPMPTTTAISRDSAASSSVMGRAWVMESSTGSPVRAEVPKSPVAALLT